MGVEDLGRSDTSHKRSDGRQSRRRTATSDWLGEVTILTFGTRRISHESACPRHVLVVYFPSCPLGQTARYMLSWRTSFAPLSLPSVRRGQSPSRCSGRELDAVCMGEGNEAAPQPSSHAQKMAAGAARSVLPSHEPRSLRKECSPVVSVGQTGSRRTCGK